MKLGTVPERRVPRRRGTGIFHEPSAMTKKSSWAGAFLEPFTILDPSLGSGASVYRTVRAEMPGGETPSSQAGVQPHADVLGEDNSRIAQEMLHRWNQAAACVCGSSGRDFHGCSGRLLAGRWMLCGALGLVKESGSGARYWRSALYSKWWRRELFQIQVGTSEAIIGVLFLVHLPEARRLSRTRRTHRADRRRQNLTGAGEVSPLIHVQVVGEQAKCVTRERRVPGAAISFPQR